MLSRGQTVTAEVEAAKAVPIRLAPGEFSLHDTLVLHASAPNRSAHDRIGLGIATVRPGCGIGPTRLRRHWCGVRTATGISTWKPRRGPRRMRRRGLCMPTASGGSGWRARASGDVVGALKGGGERKSLPHAPLSLFSMGWRRRCTSIRAWKSPHPPLLFCLAGSSMRPRHEAGSGTMAIQALGYVGIEATAPEDWAGYGTQFLGLQLAERSAAQLVFRMDDRRQRIVVTPGDRDGARFFGWEVADAAALGGPGGAAGGGRRARRARRPGAGRAAARRRPDRDAGPDRQPGRDRPWRRAHGRALPPRPQHQRLPHRRAGPGPCGADRAADGGRAAFLPRPAGLPRLRLRHQPLPCLFPAREPAAPFARADRDRPGRLAPSDDGAVQPGRRRPGLRPGECSRRAGSPPRSAATPTTS